MKVYAIIPAAGQGKRFGASKQFEPLAGKSLLLHTLEAFEDCREVEGICLVAPESEIQTAKRILSTSRVKKVKWIIAGGRERQESVKKGFDLLPPCDLVIIHDGVRPLVTPLMIEQTIQGAQEVGSCVVGLPTRDTTKEIAEGLVERTVERKTLWSIQTPQTFRYTILQKALQQAEKDHFTGTDEAVLVERIHEPVKVISGSSTNIKITTAEDLELAKAILKMRGS